MGLISRTLAGVGNAFLKASQVAGGVSAMLKVDVKPWDSLYGRFRQQDYEKLVKRYSSWVYACASKNATSVAQVPLRLYGKKRRSGTKFIVPTKAVSREQKEWLFNSPQLQTKLANAVDVEEITQHPFLDLLANVNPFMNGIDLFELWTLYQELTGNAYTYVVKNNLGAPAELWLLPSQKVRIVPDLQTFIASYIYGTKPKMVKFESDEVMHMKYPNPHDLFYGMGPLAAATVAADSGMAMSTYELNLLLNDAIPRAALTSDRDLRQDQLDKLKKEWNANYRGPKKAGKLAVFTGGLGVERLSLTPKEMGFLMGRKSTREEVAAIFGVPMSKLSVENIQKAPAGGMFHGNIMYQRDTILPKCRKMDAKLNEFLLPMYDDNLFCAFDNPVGEDKEFRLRERESNMTHGYSSINQERIRDNQEPVEWGETPWLPAGLSQTDDESRSLSPSLSGGGGDVSAPAASFAGEGKYIDPDDLPSERGRLVRIVKRMFRLQAQEVLGNMPRSGKSAKIVEEFWLPHERNWTGWLAKESTPEMLKLVKKGAKEGAKKLAVGTGIQVNAPEIEAFVKTHAYKFARSVNAETMNILRTNMSEGIMAGENMYQIRKRVEETFTGMGKYRAEMIARTESVRAVNAGMEQGWEQSGVVEAKEWDGASDMCEFCQTMHAKYGPGTGGITLGNTFIEQGDGLEGSDGGQLSTSYGAIEYPPLHPNCRCDLLPVIKDGPVDDKPVPPEPTKPTEPEIPKQSDIAEKEIASLMQQGGLSRYQAALQVRCTHAYTGHLFSGVRASNLGKATDLATKKRIAKLNKQLGLSNLPKSQQLTIKKVNANIERWIDTRGSMRLGEKALPKTPIYRGCSNDFATAMKELKKGQAFELQGVSSFTTELGIAQQFSRTRDFQQVILKVQGGVKRGELVRGLAFNQVEKEIIVGTKTKFKVLSRRVYTPEGATDKIIEITIREAA